MEAINTQTGLLGSREGHEVCSKLSRQEKANTPFDLQSFECDIVKSLSILLFLKYTKIYILLLGTKGKHMSHFLNKKVVNAHKGDVKQCKL